MPRLPALALVAFAATLLFALLAGRAGAASWARPVDGGLARAFTYRDSEPFRAGRHRGVDFAARAGALVHAACAGRVAFAGRVARQGGVVSVRCGPWRVSHLPLRGLAVRTGAHVAAGDSLGRLAWHPAHAGLHLGVRRETSRWGYVDPARFFGPTAPMPPVADRPSRPGRPPRLGPAPPPALVPEPRTAPRPRPAIGPRPAPGARPAPSTARAPATPAPALAPGVPPDPARSPAAPPVAAGWPSAAAPGGAPVAPWPAWLGLGLLLTGAVGAGARRRRRARANRAVGSAAATGRAGAP